MHHPEVWIIILNWNGLEDTIECINSLKKISYPDYRVLVVDNGSTGNDASVLRGEFGDYIHIIENDKNYGFAEGNNIGVRYALEHFKPDYFLLLNNDTVVDPIFLNEMVAVAEQSNDIAAVSPKVYYYAEPEKFEFVRAKIDLWRVRSIYSGKGKIDHGQYDDVAETERITGSCFLVRREAIEKRGLFASSFFCYAEETDFSLRARKAGYRLLYCPRAKIWHKVAASSRKVSGFTTYHLARNRFWLMKRQASWAQSATFLLWFFLTEFWFYSAAHLIYHKSVKNFLSFLKGIRDGLFKSPGKD